LTLPTALQLSIGITQRVATKLQAMLQLPTDCPSVMPSVISRVITDGFIPSVMFPREIFLARAYPSVLPSVFPSVGGFFICDRISDRNGIY